MATTTRRMPDDERVRLSDSARSADRDEIARRAYERYEERGREHGHDLDDWLEAERDLQRQSTER
jgi:hypothetical protein